MRIALTGAHGVVGSAVTTHSTHDFDLLDRREPPSRLPDGTDHPHVDRETTIVDVTDLAALVDAFDGCDAVVHLAANPATDASYAEVERNNVRGTYTALEATARTDLETFVFASSNHVVGMYEVEHAPALYEPDYDLVVDHRSPIRPDSHYGASKAAGEAWGRLYAERHGIRFYTLRIGSVFAPTWDHPYGLAERAVERGECERGSDTYERHVARLKCTWHSRRDIAQLVDRCLDDDDVTFDVFYGISDNANAWFDLERARDRIGYVPEDGADEATCTFGLGGDG